MRLAASVVLLAAFALPLYWPPAGAPPVIPATDAGLLERLFPGLPAWWQLSRLACLLAGAVLLPPAPLRLGAPAVVVAPAANGKAMRAALYVTLGLGVASLFVDRFPRIVQLAYIATLFLPALVVARVVKAPAGAAPLARRLNASTAAVLIVVGAWLVLRLPLTFHSPRIADALDMSLAFDGLERAAEPAFNVISGGIQAGGITALHLLPQGAGILGWGGVPLSASAVQCIHLAWDAVAAVAVGLLAARLVAPAAGAVAAAGLLFSPYILATTYYLGAVFLGPLFSAVLLALCLRVHRQRAPAALLLMAPLAGIAATHPALAPIAVALLGLALWTIARLRRGALTLAVPVLLFAVTLSQSLPSTRALGTIANSFTLSRTSWSAMEVGLFGQIATSLGDSITRVGRPGTLDVPLGTLLAPFAIPRTPIRLWGWNLFDPIATVLAAVGIMTCLRNAARSSVARGMLALLALALLPGVVSTYDRPSLTRLLVLPVPMALLTAIGFEHLRRLLRPRGSATLAAGVAVLAVAAGGLWLFDVVHPRLLSRSATAMAIDLVQRVAPQSPLMVRHPQWDVEEVELYARQVPRQPIPVRAFAGAATFEGIEPDIVLWSPGLEADLGVAAALCQRWPEAALFVFSDAVRRSNVFAARPRGAAGLADWPEPPVASGGCGMTLPIEAVVADAALAEANILIAQHRDAQALDLLRSMAQRTFVAVTLYDTLARVLMDRRALEEAEYWAWRGSLPKSGDARPHLTLAEIQAKRGEIDAAVESAQRGRGVADRAGDPALAGKAAELLRRLEASRGGA